MTSLFANKDRVPVFQKQILDLRFIIVFLLIWFQGFCSCVLIVDRSMTDEINMKMKRISNIRCKDSRASAFMRAFNPPIIPIRITDSTAVFKIDSEGETKILKRIRWQKEYGLDEDKMMKRVHSKYIVNAECTFRENEIMVPGYDETTEENVIIWIVLEYLDESINMKNIAKDKQKIRNIMKYTLAGLRYLHSQNIAHLDINYTNIMGKRNGNIIEYKIIDLGFARLIDHGTLMYLPDYNFGTFPYKAPEVMYHSLHGFPSDIWCLGMMCWYLSIGKIPFLGNSTDQENYKMYHKFIRELKNSSGNYKFDKHGYIDPDVLDFIRKTVVYDPAGRLSANQLLSHPFISGYDRYSENTYINN